MKLKKKLIVLSLFVILWIVLMSCNLIWSVQDPPVIQMVNTASAQEIAAARR